MTTITREEWIKALESAMASAPNDEGQTFEEIQTVMRVGRDRVGMALRAAAAAGRLAVGQRRGTNLAGYNKVTPVYRLLP